MPLPGLRNRWAPSKHSGLSSLSPKDPRSSETMTSAMSRNGGVGIVRMSDDTTLTLAHFSAATRLRSVTTALGFFSTATTRSLRVTLALLALRACPTSAPALRLARTRGPRPAPTTKSTTSTTLGSVQPVTAESEAPEPSKPSSCASSRSSYTSSPESSAPVPSAPAAAPGAAGPTASTEARFGSLGLSLHQGETLPGRAPGLRTCTMSVRARATAFRYCSYLTGSFSKVSYVCDSRLSIKGCSGACRKSR
mmetsp:Transcript_46852/g.106028  ORF Transcript_46852/g.106028 Transcript_46852/m.106028 type:complete len:251 (+) Transcript_46852:686-1438(+)